MSSPLPDLTDIPQFATIASRKIKEVKIHEIFYIRE